MGKQFTGLADIFSILHKPRHTFWTYRPNKRYKCDTCGAEFRELTDKTRMELHNPRHWGFTAVSTDVRWAGVRSAVRNG